MLCGTDSDPSWLTQKLGDEVITKGGAVVKTAELSKLEMVSFYFSAHWCPPCRNFTPKMAKTYETVNKDEKKWEVIFLSSDKDQKAFDDYFGTMPWAALAYDKRKLKEQMAKMCKVQGIPTLINYDPKNGDILNLKARDAVSKDPEGAKFPWIDRPKSFGDIIANAQLEKDGKDLTSSEVLEKNDHILLYFSAHWCPPCKKFTPDLATWYTKNFGKDKKFELIFNSWDKTEEQYNEYFGEMPWASRKYSDAATRKDLDGLYEVGGIPSLIVVDTKTGKTVTASARGKIAQDPDAKEFPWEKQPVGKLGGDVIEALNQSSCVVAVCSNGQGIAAMTSSANVYVDAAKAAGEWPTVLDVEFIVDNQTADLSKRLNDIIKRKDDEVLFIMNLSQKRLYYLPDVTKIADITEDKVKELVAGFKSGDATKAGEESGDATNVKWRAIDM